MVQKLSDIKALLASRGVRPRKRFGQNFLHDHNKLEQIISAAGLSEGDMVLEVGPGTGALTCRLLEVGVRVAAVEIDRDMCSILRQEFGDDSERWQLIEGDVMSNKHTISGEVEKAIGGRGTRFSLIANLPYNVASPLLATLAVDWVGMKIAVVMVQREVADRLIAREGGKDYGGLSVIIQAMCSVERVMILGPGCFWPRPKVDSAVVRIIRREVAMTDDPKRLSRLLAKLFTKRRKQLGGILGREVVLPEGIDGKMRPEELTVEQMIELAGMVEL